MTKFNEVNKTLTNEEAFKEADRCLSCKKPRCELGCPASLPIRDFILKLKQRNINEAYDLILEKSNYSSICSRVCDHQKQCIGNCILNVKQNPINVGGLERFINDNQTKELKLTKNEKVGKVAIIGAGPAGLSCALELAKNNVDVVVFEKESYLGGVSAYGIPEYRLPIDVLNKHIDNLKKYNIDFVLNKDMSNTDLNDLKKEGFDKVFISIGLTSSKLLNIENENAVGVVDANVFLKQVNENIKFNKGVLPHLKGKTIVVGAGNVAMDAARTAKRISDNDVIIVYRRSIDEAPASKLELKESHEEGVLFNFLTNPTKVLTDDNNNVIGVRCEKMILLEADESGRRIPSGSGEFLDIECNNIIVAIGQAPNTSLITKNSIDNKSGYIVTNDELLTNKDYIYAGGDIVRGADTVVRSMVDGKKAASIIISSLK
ncbi:MAG: FAD-dependent oxidoreductase [Anaeroplasmataceae bacterium]